MVQNEKKIRSGPLHKKCVSQDLYMPKRECSLLLYPVAVCHMKPNNPFSFIQESFRIYSGILNKVNVLYSKLGPYIVGLTVAV